MKKEIIDPKPSQFLSPINGGHGEICIIGAQNHNTTHPVLNNRVMGVWFVGRNQDFSQPLATFHLN